MANNPIVIDPPAFDQSKAWDECRQHVERCGGLTYSDGEGKYMAAAGADPGLVSCPACHEYHWAWGRRQRCTKCAFEYETNWWCMFSWGVQYGERARSGKFVEFAAKMKAKYGGHPYFDYGWEHPELLDRGDLFKTAHELDWRSIMSIACPRCMPPGDPSCPYCGGTYGVPAATHAPVDAGDEDGGGE